MSGIANGGVSIVGGLGGTGGGGGSGTVTSVATGANLTGGPITTSGTISFDGAQALHLTHAGTALTVDNAMQAADITATTAVHASFYSSGTTLTLADGFGSTIALDNAGGLTAAASAGIGLTASAGNIVLTPAGSPNYIQLAGYVVVNNGALSLVGGDNFDFVASIGADPQVRMYGGGDNVNGQWTVAIPGSAGSAGFTVHSDTIPGIGAVTAFDINSTRWNGYAYFPSIYSTEQFKFIGADSSGDFHSGGGTGMSIVDNDPTTFTTGLYFTTSYLNSAGSTSPGTQIFGMNYDGVTTSFAGLQGNTSFSSQADIRLEAPNSIGLYAAGDSVLPVNLELIPPPCKYRAVI